MARLFDPIVLRAYANELPVARAELAEKLALLRNLVVRLSSPAVLNSKETVVEQSFNERLFAELFDYQTLFRDGMGNYHLRPKNYYSQRRRYDDFALGFFEGDEGSRLVLAELKSPGTDLEAPQTSGRYAGRTPIEQAFDAAAGSEARWIVVSNFDEIRIFSTSSAALWESIRLTDILSIGELARAYALLGKPSLLGCDATKPSPLDNLEQGNGPMIVPKKDNAIRLVQEARLKDPSEEFSFPELDDALQAGLVLVPSDGLYTWPLRLKGQEPALSRDRLVVELSTEEDGLLSRLELTKNAVLRVSEYLPLDTPGVNAHDLCIRVGFFVMLANETLGQFADEPILYESTLHETQGAMLSNIQALANGAPSVAFRAPGDMESIRASTSSRRVQTPTKQDMNSLPAWGKVCYDLVRELIFPFEGRRPATGLLSRVRPDENSVTSVLSVAIDDI